MTDKQIIIDVCPYQGECSVSGCKRNDDGCFVRQLFEERNRAENRIVELNKSIQAKEQECEKLKEQLEIAKQNYSYEAEKLEIYIQTLAEIKPTLEFYANSKMGEEQPDRTYKIMLSNGYIMTYDPKPAREALRKINEVEDE